MLAKLGKRHAVQLPAAQMVTLGVKLTRLVSEVDLLLTKSDVYVILVFPPQLVQITTMK